MEWALTHGYDDSLTIDRIDSKKGYEPENCEWVTKSENSRRAHPKQFHIGTSEARLRANSKYLKNTVEDIKVRVPKGKKEYYKKASALAGSSLNQFIIDAIDEKIIEDGIIIPEE